MKKIYQYLVSRYSYDQKCRVICNIKGFNMLHALQRYGTVYTNKELASITNIKRERMIPQKDLSPLELDEFKSQSKTKTKK